VIAIGQASHAWLSGQLARAWGNEHFGALHPREEMCLAAEQHDVGMAAWDLHPTYNPDTGRPHSFVEMPLETHLELWTAGPRRLITQSRYAALLVSMHGRRLYELRDLDKMDAADAAAVKQFIEDQNALQRQLLDSLVADERTADPAAPAVVNHNSDLIWTWDALSLGICLDWAPYTARAVPTAGDPADLRLEHGSVPGTLTLDPWPLTPADAVIVRCEGRRLTQAAASASQLADALARAPWETVEFELRRAVSSKASVAARAGVQSWNAP
jgi:hypothetical protein